MNIIIIFCQLTLRELISNDGFVRKANVTSYTRLGIIISRSKIGESGFEQNVREDETGILILRNFTDFEGK
jgi:hypothetical protein